MALHVLIVEDEPLIALDLAGIVEHAGHVVAGMASDLRQAMAVADAGGVDLAFLDVNLARQPDGVEVCHKLREAHDIPSIFVSASITDDVRRRAAACNPIGFVSKPFLERDVVRPLQHYAATIDT